GAAGTHRFYSGINSRNAKHHKTNCSPDSSSPEGRTKCWKYGKEACTMSYPQVKHPPFKRLYLASHTNQLQMIKNLVWNLQLFCEKIVCF
uniref:Uncharacterized protein n=1 Tax=Taeniopygia guttata TaxID=59729 RepID=A0A674H9L0_TAEGU